MSTTNQVSEILRDNEEHFKRDEKAQKYVHASKKFEKLVNMGMVEKRGYRLLSSEQAPIDRLHFNKS